MKLNNATRLKMLKVSAAFFGIVLISIFIYTHFLVNSTVTTQAATSDTTLITTLTQTLISSAAKSPYSTSDIPSLTSIASQRKAAMLSALSSGNTKSVFGNLLTQEQINKLPASLVTNNLLEKLTVAKGYIEVIHSDAFQSKNSKIEYYYRTSKNSKISRPLYFSAAPSLRNNARVQLDGYSLDTSLLVPAARTNPIKVLSLPIIPATGVQRLAVILVNFSNNTSKPFSAEDTRLATFGDTNSVANFYKEVSNGLATLTGEVYDYVTIQADYNQSCLTYRNTWSALANSQLIARIGRSAFDQYQRRMYIFNAANCPYTGQGTIGGTLDSPSEAWIYGNINKFAIAHEFGHNLGLAHANGYNCISTPECQNIEYGDNSDVMGATNRLLQLNVPHRVGLGWMPNVQYLTPGTYNTTIVPIETTGSGQKTVSFMNSGTSEQYYLEYRQPIGAYDSALIPNSTIGARLIAWNNSPSTQTNLVYTAVPPPGTNDSDAFNFTDGFTYVNPRNNITVKQVSHSPNGVNVSISIPDAYSASPISPWKQTTSMQTGVNSQAMSYANGFFYVVGGLASGNSQTAKVTAGKVNSDGTINSWSTTTPYPMAVEQPAMASDGTYLYVTGGYTGTTINSAVYSAKTDSTGDIAGWIPTTSLPMGTLGHSSLVVNNKLYVFGGLTANGTNQVAFAPITGNGTIGAWQQTAPLQIQLTKASAVAINGRIYVSGTEGSANSFTLIYSAAINVDGSISNWIAEKQFPVHLSDFTMTGLGNYLIVIGGRDLNFQANGLTYGAIVQSDGTLGDWRIMQNQIPIFSHSVATTGNLIVYTGGLNQDYTTENTVYISTMKPVNACNGSCQADYQCGSGLSCYAGFCRKPRCSTDTGCGC